MKNEVKIGLNKAKLRPYEALLSLNKANFLALCANPKIADVADAIERDHQQ